MNQVNKKMLKDDVHLFIKFKYSDVSILNFDQVFLPAEQSSRTNHQDKFWDSMFLHFWKSLWKKLIIISNMKAHSEWPV